MSEYAEVRIQEKIKKQIGEIQSFEVLEVLPYRQGRISSYKKQETIDLVNNRVPESIYEEYRRIHRKLAGDKADNHQIIICKHKEQKVALIFSDYFIFVFYNAEVIVK